VGGGWEGGGFWGGGGEGRGVWRGGDGGRGEEWGDGWGKGKDREDLFFFFLYNYFLFILGFNCDPGIP